jgi:hypothetical protein
MSMHVWALSSSTDRSFPLGGCRLCSSSSASIASCTQLVHILQAEKNLVFLQRPTKVGELFGPGTGGVHLGEEVPLDVIGMGATSITFCAHLPENVRKAHQAFLPHDDGTLSTIQLPLPGTKLLL